LDIVATFYPRSVSELHVVVPLFLSREQLARFVKERVPRMRLSGVLQAFVAPHGTHNRVLRAEWTPSSFQVLERVAGLPLEHPKSRGKGNDVDSRLATFERNHQAPLAEGALVVDPNWTPEERSKHEEHYLDMMLLGTLAGGLKSGGGGGGGGGGAGAAAGGIAAGAGHGLLDNPTAGASATGNAAGSAPSGATASAGATTGGGAAPSSVALYHASSSPASSVAPLQTTLAYNEHRITQLECADKALVAQLHALVWALARHLKQVLVRHVKGSPNPGVESCKPVLPLKMTLYFKQGPGGQIYLLFADEFLVAQGNPRLLERLERQMNDPARDRALFGGAGGPGGGGFGGNDAASPSSGGGGFGSPNGGGGGGAIGSGGSAAAMAAKMALGGKIGGVGVGAGDRPRGGGGGGGGSDTEDDSSAAASRAGSAPGGGLGPRTGFGAAGGGVTGPQRNKKKAIDESFAAASSSSGLSNDKLMSASAAAAAAAAAASAAAKRAPFRANMGLKEWLRYCWSFVVGEHEWQRSGGLLELHREQAREQAREMAAAAAMAMAASGGASLSPSGGSGLHSRASLGGFRSSGVFGAGGDPLFDVSASPVKRALMLAGSSTGGVASSPATFKRGLDASAAAAAAAEARWQRARSLAFEVAPESEKPGSGHTCSACQHEFTLGWGSLLSDQRLPLFQVLPRMVASSVGLGASTALLQGAAGVAKHASMSSAGGRAALNRAASLAWGEVLLTFFPRLTEGKARQLLRNKSWLENTQVQLCEICMQEVKGPAPPNSEAAVAASMAAATADPSAPVVYPPVPSLPELGLDTLSLLDDALRDFLGLAAHNTLLLEDARAVERAMEEEKTATEAAELGQEQQEHDRTMQVQGDELAVAERSAGTSSLALATDADDDATAGADGFDGVLRPSPHPVRHAAHLGASKARSTAQALFGSQQETGDGEQQPHSAQPHSATTSEADSFAAVQQAKKEKKAQRRAARAEAKQAAARVARHARIEAEAIRERAKALGLPLPIAAAASSGRGGGDNAAAAAAAAALADLDAEERRAATALAKQLALEIERERADGEASTSAAVSHTNSPYLRGMQRPLSASRSSRTASEEGDEKHAIGRSPQHHQHHAPREPEREQSLAAYHREQAMLRELAAAAQAAHHNNNAPLSPPSTSGRATPHAGSVAGASSGVAPAWSFLRNSRVRARDAAARAALREERLFRQAEAEAAREHERRLKLEGTPEGRAARAELFRLQAAERLRLHRAQALEAHLAAEEAHRIEEAQARREALALAQEKRRQQRTPLERVPFPVLAAAGAAPAFPPPEVVEKYVREQGLPAGYVQAYKRSYELFLHDAAQAAAELQQQQQQREQQQRQHRSPPRSSKKGMNYSASSPSLFPPIGGSPGVSTRRSAQPPVGSVPWDDRFLAGSSMRSAPLLDESLLPPSHASHFSSAFSAASRPDASHAVYPRDHTTSGRAGQYGAGASSRIRGGGGRLRDQFDDEAEEERLMREAERDANPSRSPPRTAAELLAAPAPPVDPDHHLFLAYSKPLAVARHNSHHSLAPLKDRAVTEEEQQEEDPEALLSYAASPVVEDKPGRAQGRGRIAHRSIDAASDAPGGGGDRRSSPSPPPAAASATAPTGLPYAIELHKYWQQGHKTITHAANLRAKAVRGGGSSKRKEQQQQQLEAEEQQPAPSRSPARSKKPAAAAIAPRSEPKKAAGATNAAPPSSSKKRDPVAAPASASSSDVAPSSGSAAVAPASSANTEEAEHAAARAELAALFQSGRCAVWTDLLASAEVDDAFVRELVSLTAGLVPAAEEEPQQHQRQSLSQRALDLLTSLHGAQLAEPVTTAAQLLAAVRDKARVHNLVHAADLPQTAATTQQA
jgi:hypothetical protein